MFFRKIFLQLKSIRLMAFVPIVAADLLLPLIAVASYQSERLDFYETVMKYGMMLIPVLSIIWSLFSLKECIEGKGNELLFVGKNRLKLLDCFVMFALFYATVVPQFIVYSLIDAVFLTQIIRIFAICFFFFGVAYFLVFLTKSISLTLMCLIIYAISNMLISSRSKLAFMLYFDIQPYGRDAFFSQSLPLIVLSVMLLFIGAVLNRKYCKFN